MSGRCHRRPGHRSRHDWDGVDYVPGTTGFRGLATHFVRDCALVAHAKGMTYIAVHNHGGFDRVRFSDVDLSSAELFCKHLVAAALTLKKPSA